MRTNPEKQFPSSLLFSFHCQPDPLAFAHLMHWTASFTANESHAHLERKLWDAAGLRGPIGWAGAAGAGIKPCMFTARIRVNLPKGARTSVGPNILKNHQDQRIRFSGQHSAQTVSEVAFKHDRIQVLPLNPDYDPIPVAPHEGLEMVVIGEWVASID